MLGKRRAGTENRLNRASSPARAYSDQGRNSQNLHSMHQQIEQNESRNNKHQAARISSQMCHPSRLTSWSVLRPSWVFGV